MANRHDLVTRKAYHYLLELVFFDIDARKEVVRYAERITRWTPDKVVESEFLKHKNDTPYILTRVHIVEVYENLYSMTPEKFYRDAELKESVKIDVGGTFSRPGSN